MAAAENRSPSPQPPAQLVGYHFSGSSIDMIQLLKAKNSKTMLVKDPSISFNLYTEPPWVRITQETLPALVESGEHIIYSERSRLQGVRVSYDRKLKGDCRMFFWEENHEREPVYDFDTDSIVGWMRYFALYLLPPGVDANGKKFKKVNTYWYMVEFETTDANNLKTLCKLRLENKEVKTARSLVPKLLKSIKTAEVAIAIGNSKGWEVGEELSKSRVAREKLQAAKEKIRNALGLMTVANDNDFERFVLGPRRERAEAAAAAAEAAAEAVPINDYHQALLLQDEDVNENLVDGAALLEGVV